MSAAPNIKDVAPRTEQPGGGAALSLTPRQREIAIYTDQHRASHGYSPTLQEIANRFGIDKSTVVGHVEALLHKGVLVNRGHGVARALELSEDARRVLVQEARTSLRWPVVGVLNVNRRRIEALSGGAV